MSRLLPILSIEPGSAAERAGVRAGERIRRLNGVPLRDVIDLRFEGAEEELVAELEDAEGRAREVRIERHQGETLGLETEEMKARTCANKCVFCFIDQMPKGGRRGLYVRDEDYRFSFLHGNYVTLTNTRERELERIIEQGLSPIYVSVHATDAAVRARLLGIEDLETANVVPLLERLAAGGVRIHAQVVVCPGWNDGAVLEETIDTLATLHPGVESVAVVPLGVTSHRQALPTLRPVTVELAHAVLEQCQVAQRRFEERWDRSFVYLADEWYFLTETPIPDRDHYHDFPQLEDGVGMTRSFIDHLQESGASLPVIERARGRRLSVVTAVMAAPIIEEYLVDGLLRKVAAHVDLVVVENDFLGSGITVSGLLGGQDIVRAVLSRGAGDLVLLPPNCVNGRRLFLDDLSFDELAASIGAPVELGLGDETFNTNPVWEKE